MGQIKLDLGYIATLSMNCAFNFGVWCLFAIVMLTTYLKEGEDKSKWSNEYNAFNSIMLLFYDPDEDDL